MKKLFEGFRRFLTESEEDRTLGKLLQLDPEHAASFIDSLKDVYPDIERRYVDALGTRVKRMEKEGEKQDIVIARLSKERWRINREYDQISEKDGWVAAREFFRDNMDRLNDIERKMREASYEKARFFDDGRELRKIMAKFNPEIVVPFPGIAEEGKKAPKTKKDPPYRERGATESQAQQMAAGIALSARRGDTPVSKLKGAALEMYNDKSFTTKEIENLATLGQKVRGHKSKEPKHRKSLPGHATPAKD